MISKKSRILYVLIALVTVPSSSLAQSAVPSKAEKSGEAIIYCNFGLYTHVVEVSVTDKRGREITTLCVN
jgi:hypothetical protein